MNSPRIYLDHAAGTPVDPAALAESTTWMARAGPSASSSHEEGRALKDALEAARTQVARALGVRAREVIFTSGGTEAARIAVQGLAASLPPSRRRIVTTAIEHAAIREPLEALRLAGFEIVEVPVNEQGCVSASDVLSQVTENTGFVSVQAVNHEMGAIQPVRKIATGLAGRGIPLLCDASLAPGRVPCTAEDLGAQVTLFSGTKFGGLPGTGMLILKRGTKLAGLPGGGLQEEGVRPGSENVPGLVGTARAFVTCIQEHDAIRTHLEACTTELLTALEDADATTALGTADVRAPGIVTLFVPGVEGEALLINLDLAGVSVASGSTCALGSHDPSPSLLAMGMRQKDAASTIRISCGRGNTLAHMRLAAEVVKETSTRLRALARGRR